MVESMNLPTLQQLQWFGTLCGIFVGVATIHKTFPNAFPSIGDRLRRFTWGPVAEYFRGVALVIAAVPRIEGEVTQIKKRVEAELGPNGGGSMKDQVTVIAARQAAIFDGMSRPAFQADATGRFVSVNRAFESMTGYPSRDLLEMGWVNLIHQNEVEEFMIAWHHAIDDGRILRRACVIVTATDMKLTVCVDAIPVKVGKRVIEWQGTFEKPEAA